MASCASCGKTDKLLKCGGCQKVSYCSKDCQKTQYKAHKYICRPSNDALAKLRQIVEVSMTSSSDIVAKLFNTAEIRMAFLSCLSAKDLLKAQGICRLFYSTIELEPTLQQRLFLSPGPGQLVRATNTGSAEMNMAITPRNKDQRDHAKIDKGAGPPPYLITTASGCTEEKYAAQLEKAKIPIILNPFFTKLWPQDPGNMTVKPQTTTSTTNKTASWRRMQITSPPMLELNMSVWYTDTKGKGHQDRPSTRKITTGVTLGHLADLLTAMPSKRTPHWVQLDGYACWTRSADAVVASKAYRADGKNPFMPGVYVNPSNGIAFPGFF